jgi:hypothetical protein
MTKYGNHWKNKPLQKLTKISQQGSKIFITLNNGVSVTKQMK